LTAVRIGSSHSCDHQTWWNDDGLSM
jgi:hypothetical protein